MDILLDILHRLTYASNHYAHGIRLGTALLAGLCGIFILWLRKQTTTSNLWAWYFGWAYIAYLIDYGLQFGIGYFGKGFLSSASIETLNRFIAVIGSNLTSLLFLAAARALLRVSPEFPLWAIVLSFLGLVGMIPETNFLWGRVPDAFFSTISLTWFGYATAKNISFRPRTGRWLVIGAWIVAGFYIFAQPIYATAPFLSRERWSSDNRIVRALSQQGEDKNKPPPYLQLPQKLLDNLFIAMILPLKFYLFFFASLVLLRTVFAISTRRTQEILLYLLESRGDFLAGSELLRSIGLSLDADLVKLVMRTPGQENERLEVREWRRENKETFPFHDQSPKLNLPSSSSSAIGKVLRDGKAIFYDGRLSPQNQWLIRLSEVKEKSSVILVPIYLHGAVAGCLLVESKMRRAFSATAFEHIEHLASLISISLQYWRGLAAASIFTSHYTAWRIQQKKIDLESDLQWVTNLLHDTLAPLTTIVVVQAGFKRLETFAGQESHAQKLLLQLKESAETLRTLDEDGKNLEVVEISLTGKQAPFEFSGLGKLVMVLPAEKDDPARPMLGVSHSIQRVFRALLINTISDLMLDYFSYKLKEFVVNLNANTELATEHRWLQQVKTLVEQVGMCWVVVPDLIEPEAHGLAGAIEAVQQIQSASQPANETEDIVCYDVTNQVEGAQQIIRIYLPNAKKQIWLGIKRQNFGAELKTSSPWRIFLTRFADIADSALMKLLTERELASLEAEASQSRFAITTDTLLHQMTNYVKDLTNSINTLRDGWLIGEIKAEGKVAELIQSLPESAQNLAQLSREVLNVRKVDTRRPCLLLEAVERTEKLFALILEKQSIKLIHRIAPTLEIDMPFHVAFHALNNLVSNAKDAFRNHGGEIRIEAEDVGEMIHCYVTDDGPGIPERLMPRIFTSGVTTKDGGGLGLYLVKRSLKENRADIELSETGPGGTKFTMRLPKVKQEN